MSTERMLQEERERAGRGSSTGLGRILCHHPMRPLGPSVHAKLRRKVDEDDEDDAATTDENAMDGRFRDDDDGKTDDDSDDSDDEEGSKGGLRKGKERVGNVWELGI